jgi:hypothetical protein
VARAGQRTAGEAAGPAVEDQAATPDTIASLDDLRLALGGEDRPVEAVRVLEWPGKPTFYLRGLTGHDRDTIENTTFGDGVNDISAKIVARALCTPDGEPLVPRAKIAEVEQMLTKRSAGGLLRLMRVARRMSGLDRGAVDELEQLLKADPSGNSGSD